MVTALLCLEWLRRNILLSPVLVKQLLFLSENIVVSSIVLILVKEVGKYTPSDLSLVLLLNIVFTRDKLPQVVFQL